MRLGLFMMPLHAPRRDLPTLLREDEEAILLADRLGFDEAWVGEHLTAATEPIASPLIFLASLIAKTGKIRLGTGVLALPRLFAFEEIADHGNDEHARHRRGGAHRHATRDEQRKAPGKGAQQ